MHAGKVPCCVHGNAHPTRAHIKRTCSEAAPCLHHPTPLRRIECRWNLLPPEQPRVVIPYSQWRRRYNNDTRVSAFRSKMASRIELGQAFGLKKGVNVFLKPASPIELSRGINQTSNAGKREALTTGTSPFSCSERRLFHPRASEVKGTSDNTRAKKIKTADLMCPVETSPLLPDNQQSRHLRPDPSRRKAT